MRPNGLIDEWLHSQLFLGVFPGIWILSSSNKVNSNTIILKKGQKEGEIFVLTIL